jgi:polyisoprenoid-binding protein YceI
MMQETSTPSPVRLVDGVELPVPGRWRIDPGHAEVAFVGRHLLFTKVRGRFRNLDGYVEIGDDPTDSAVEVSIEMASVDSGDNARDEHLRSPDFFGVDRFPVATFSGCARRWSGRTGTLGGELTIKGATRPVELDVAYLGTVTDPWGGERAIFSASGTVNREDWGLTWNMPLAGGGVLVSKDIQLEIELETVRER